MAQTKARIVIPGRVYVYLAPSATAAPADEAVALAAAYKELGYTKDDSTEITYNPDADVVRAHQSDYPVRTFLKGAECKIKTTLLEWSADNFKVGMGGGTAATVSAGHFKWSPPNNGLITDYVLVLEVRDGTKRYRWISPSVSALDNFQIPLQKKEASQPDINWTVNGSDPGDAFYLLTNDTAFDSASSTL